MTLASSIIQRAYRESNLIPSGATPTATQLSEGLVRLNGILLSTVGNEAGDDLRELSIGGDFDESTFTTDWVPDNARLMLNLTAALELDLDPYPQNGQRVGIVDVGSNLATYNLTLDGNGRNIEGAATLVLSTDDTNKQWMYRSDIGNWVLISELEDDDDMPFPLEFDEYFVMTLAMRINPLYGQGLSAETQRMLQRMRSQLSARYTIEREMDPDLPYLEHDYRRYSSDTGEFERGIRRIRRW